MEPTQRYRVTVTFDNGVKASVWMTAEPQFPPSLWLPETLSLIGDAGGPWIEFHGDEVLSLSIDRMAGPSHRTFRPVQQGAD